MAAEVGLLFFKVFSNLSDPGLLNVFLTLRLLLQMLRTLLLAWMLLLLLSNATTVEKMLQRNDVVAA